MFFARTSRHFQTLAARRYPTRFVPRCDALVLITFLDLRTHSCIGAGKHERDHRSTALYEHGSQPQSPRVRLRAQFHNLTNHRSSCLASERSSQHVSPSVRPRRVHRVVIGAADVGTDESSCSRGAASMRGGSSVRTLVALCLARHLSASRGLIVSVCQVWSERSCRARSTDLSKENVCHARELMVRGYASYAVARQHPYQQRKRNASSYRTGAERRKGWRTPP